VVFTNRLTQLSNLGGTPLQNDSLFLKQTTAISGNTQQTTSLTGLTPPISKGYVRVKVYDAGGTSPTLLNLIVNMSDGTTFVNVAFFAPVVAIAPALSVTPGGTQLATNGAITSGAAILTSASNPFTPSMVGQAISISTAGSGATILYTTILSYQSAGQVTLAANAGATATAGTVTLTGNYGNGGSNTSLGGIDFLIPFETDISATQCSVLTTLGGTSPTATVDIEVSGTS
jgi:hypothetical protein